ncbi:MAG TPA: hypothetical protein VF406_18600 [Thermodesulfobacteriota bacterium]
MARTTRGGGAGRPPSGREADDPGLITRIERVAKSIGVNLPAADQLREVRDQARGDVAPTAATEAAAYLGSDARAQAAAGVVVVLVDAAGEMVSKRVFGRRPR